MQKTIACTVAIITTLSASPAFAASSTQEQLTMCVDALETRGIASRSDYRVNFKGVRGGGTKKLKVLMSPKDKDKAAIKATCIIKRGKLVDIVIEA